MPRTYSFVEPLISEMIAMLIVEMVACAVNNAVNNPSVSVMVKTII